MKRLAVLSLLLPVVIHLAYSRSINFDDSNSVSDGLDSSGKMPSFLEWGNLSAATETCAPIYGFLPCSTNVWGLLFLIVVYEILLSIGGQYVATGSGQFFQIIGPGVVGASLFQFLGTFPQVVLVLVSSLTGSLADAQQRATLSMGLVAGTTVMLLTLIWGIAIVLGSYDLSPSTDDSVNKDQTTVKANFGVVTDAETSFTAWIIPITLIPFVILQLQIISHSSSWRRAVILIALVVASLLLVGYVVIQVFQPWIHNRCFAFLINNNAKDKLLQLLTKNGKPDTRKIKQMFAKIDTNTSASISPQELKVFLLGVKMDDVDLNTDNDIINIMSVFDKSRDGNISQDEFVKGMTKLVSDLSNPTPNSISYGGANSQNATQAPQVVLANSTVTTQLVSDSSNPTSNSISAGGTTSQNATQAPQGASASSTVTIQTVGPITWVTYLTVAFNLIFGLVILCAFSEPLIKIVVDFSIAANFSPFTVSYVAIPFAMNYGVALQTITSAGQKTQISNSLTLSALYGGVYMNNIIGLIVFLVPVFSRNLTSGASAEIILVLIICIFMTLLTSVRTTFPQWLGYVVILLYPISLALVYVLTSVLGWS